MNVRLRAAAVLFIVAAGVPCTQAGALAVPTIVLRASASFAAGMHGVVGMQRHFTTQLQIGSFAHEEQSDSGQLMQDGRFAKIAYYRIVREGHAFSPSQMQKRENEANEDWAAGKVFFKEPYDPQYSKDYVFGAPQAGCGLCSPETESVTFASPIHDTQHGSGVMYIETSTAHVVKLTYTAYVLPPHAASGTVTEIGGPALRDLWCVVRIDETYRGRAFLINGRATFVGVFDHFRRFASLDAGDAALQDRTI